MKPQRIVTIRGPEQDQEVTYEWQDDCTWKQVAVKIIDHPIKIPEEARRTSDGVLIHQPPPQELPPVPVHLDPLGEAELKWAQIEKAKKEARH